MPRCPKGSGKRRDTTLSTRCAHDMRAVLALTLWARCASHCWGRQPKECNAFPTLSDQSRHRVLHSGNPSLRHARLTTPQLGPCCIPDPGLVVRKCFGRPLVNQPAPPILSPHTSVDYCCAADMPAALSDLLSAQLSTCYLSSPVVFPSLYLHGCAVPGTQSHARALGRLQAVVVPEGGQAVRSLIKRGFGDGGREVYGCRHECSVL